MKALFKEALEDENIYAFVAWDNDRPISKKIISEKVIQLFILSIFAC